MASMAGVVNTFSTQTSIAAPDREAGRIYCLPSGTDRSGARFLCAVGIPVVSAGTSRMGLRDRGIVLQVDPSPRLRLTAFNGARPARECLIGHGAGAPPLYQLRFPPPPSRVDNPDAIVFPTLTE